MFSYRSRKRLIELSERNIGKYSLMLELLLHCSKAIGVAGPHHNAIEITKKSNLSKEIYILK
jgi:hypothetical protein